MEDMKYYDEECEAHKTLKVNAKTLGIEGMMMIYYDPVVIREGGHDGDLK